MNDDLPPDEDFAALFAASLKTSRIEKGQTLEGAIVAIGADVAFVNVGGKGEATIALDELRDDDGALEAGVGDRIQATVVSTDGGVVLSRKLIRGAASLRQLEDAWRAGLTVDGKVEREVKGGYEVRVAKQRAFCPISQIDIVRTTDSAVHVGRTYSFRIIEFKEGGRNLVVSRRALLEEEQKAQAEAIRRTIVPGAIVTGRVVSVRDFGAFVDLGGGLQGLLHVSEMAWSRVSAASVVAVGDEITVKVLRVDDDGPPSPGLRRGSPERVQREGGQKIALGLKQLAEDPWSKVQATYEVGQVRSGRVTRHSEFGAFVELEPGIEALAHISTFPPSEAPAARARIASGSERRSASERGWGPASSERRRLEALAPVGFNGDFEILSIDADKKRIGVALVPEGSSRAAGSVRSASEIVPGARLRGTVERHQPFGVFVYLGPGRTGLIPTSETGVSNEAEMAKALPVGSPVDVIVLDVDADGRKIRLSRKAVDAAEEAAEVRDYTERSGTPASGGLGSLADKLRGALGSKDR